jgi:excinuclease UvrABC nuclease subunit
MKTKKEILSSKREFKEDYIIYALINNNEIVYIGQSKNIVVRLSSHRTSNKVFDSWCIVENLGTYTTSKEVNRLEEKYIRKFLPKYNKIHNTEYQKKVLDRNKSLKEQKEKTRRKNIWKRSQIGIVSRG